MSRAWPLAFILAMLCAAGAIASPGPEYVILVSIDGFRADDLGSGATPVLDRLAAAGASGPLRPSFPSLTFPNHYTLVTGREPDRHGVVANSFVDPELGPFSMTSLESGFWDQAEPIWITAEKAGIPTATMFWPGSEIEIQGLRPRYWVKFARRVDETARVGQILNWLALPPKERPRLLTLYFNRIDIAGHRYGPDAPETRAAIARVDAAIGHLVEGLKTAGLSGRTVLVVVSDHGMAATAPDRTIWLDDMVDPAALRIGYNGALLLADPSPGREAEARSLIGSHPHMTCYDKGRLPERLHYGRHPRVARIVCLAETGWLISTRDNPLTSVGGAHGYDNAAREMQAVFIAQGPGVAVGRKVTDLDAVDIQPLLARLLGIKAPPGDGRARDSLPVSGVDTPFRRNHKRGKTHFGPWRFEREL